MTRDKVLRRCAHRERGMARAYDNAVLRCTTLLNTSRDVADPVVGSGTNGSSSSSRRCRHRCAVCPNSGFRQIILWGSHCHMESLVRGKPHVLLLHMIQYTVVKQGGLRLLQNARL